MPQNRINLYVKRKLVIDGRLTFEQRQMYNMGIEAVRTVKERISRGSNEFDAKSMRLAKRYAIAKTKRGLRNYRDLKWTGQMLENFQLRQVNNTEAFARNTRQKDRQKAQRNNQLERWVVYSRSNVDDVMKLAVKEFGNMTRKIVSGGNFTLTK